MTAQKWLKSFHLIYLNFIQVSNRYIYKNNTGHLNDIARTLKYKLVILIHRIYTAYSQVGTCSIKKIMKNWYSDESYRRYMSNLIKSYPQLIHRIYTAYSQLERYK